MWLILTMLRIQHRILIWFWNSQINNIMNVNKLRKTNNRGSREVVERSRKEGRGTRLHWIANNKFLHKIQDKFSYLMILMEFKASSTVRMVLVWHRSKWVDNQEDPRAKKDTNTLVKRDICQLKIHILVKRKDEEANVAVALIRSPRLLIMVSIIDQLLLTYKRIPLRKFKSNNITRIRSLLPRIPSKFHLINTMKITWCPRLRTRLALARRRLSLK